ncbi:MAG TPA: DUF4242 domain-containing protein [Pricia sp.]|nr:DUF4242 domain-containing protein [Pricia sp.]
MKTIHLSTLMLGLLMSLTMYSQNLAEVRATMNQDMMQKEKSMKTYVIEREIPDAGKLTTEELKGISQKSNDVLSAMGPGIEWQHSYVTDNKIFCVYKAENEKLLIEHAERGGFPANNIHEISTVIDPGTAKD